MGINGILLYTCGGLCICVCLLMNHVFLNVAIEQGSTGSSSKLFHRQRYAVQVQGIWRGKSL